MTEPTPRLWATIVLPKPHELPGYDAFVAQLERGEKVFAVDPPPKPKRARVKRTLASLIEERDRLEKERSRFTSTEPADTAAGRLNQAGMKRHYKHTDSELARYAALSDRIAGLEFRIKKESR